MAFESLAVINSFIRTLLALLFVGVVGLGGWYGYNTYYAKENAQQELVRAQQELIAHRREIQGLREEVQAKEAEILRLTTANRLLKMQHRVAQLSVLEQGEDESGQLYSKVRFVEVNEEGDPIGEPKTFRLRGDLVYVDNWVVKFEDKYVERADLDRGHSIVLFRRIYGEHQNPAEGYPLDPVGTHPQSYAKGSVSEFEQGIWDDFWNIARDNKKAAELGIRAAHGDAVYTKVEEGKRYKIELRASDGLSITPDGDVPADQLESDRTFS